MGLKLPTRINLNERSVLKLKLHGKLITKLTLKPISLQILSILISLVLCHRHLHMVAYTIYTICFIDDYSGLITVYFLKRNSDAVGTAEIYFADMVPYGEIKRLRSDNG